MIKSKILNVNTVKLNNNIKIVNQDILKANFGSSARASNILSVLEMKGFITKPEGSNRWEIHFDLIESALAELKQKQGQSEEDF